MSVSSSVIAVVVLSRLPYPWRLSFFCLAFLIMHLCMIFLNSLSWNLRCICHNWRDSNGIHDSIKSREEMMARILFLVWFLQPKQTDLGSHRVHLTVLPRFLWSRYFLPLRRSWLFSSRSGSKNPPGKKKDKTFFLVFAFSSPAIKFSTSISVKVRNLPLSFLSSFSWKILRLKFGIHRECQIPCLLILSF